ncbi:MAG: hydrogenase nickel incorporation protein HypB [Lachnospiraceae bacterium]|nr:hydrogenase nickel incorporation protein HypB [Lachnospiraceae bacterium]
MGNVRIIDVNMNINADNDAIAAEIREKNKKDHTFMINLMASPGAGKTSVLLRTLEALKDDYKIGVMEADIDASVDAEKIAAAGGRSIQVHTGGECAMDAEMTRQAMEEFQTEDLDLLVLENVGNLVCPAETDTGATVNVEILSIPEGDDKPLKYPLMFTVCDLVLVNKIDTRDYFSFDDEAFIARVKKLNPQAKIIFLSAKTGEGFDTWITWLKGALIEDK